MEAMEYIVATVHMRGFARIFRTGDYTPNAADHDAVKARGREIFSQGFAVLDEALGRKEYLIGGFSIADAALFYIEFWAADRLHHPLPPNCAAHYARMKARPAVQQAMKAEGF